MPLRCRREPNVRAATADLIAEFRGHAVTATSTDMSLNASLAPTKLPTIGVDCQMARVTATGIRLSPPTLRLVGSKVIHPAPGTKTSVHAWVDPASLDPTLCWLGL